MHITTNNRLQLAHKLAGQRLVIPDMRPIMSHWPSQQHGDYEIMRAAVDKRFARLLTSEKNRKAINDADPALLAAKWWPTISTKEYRVMTDLVIWFGLWDDVIEKLGDDEAAAEDLRISTKDFIRRSFGLSRPEEDGSERGVAITNPLILSFWGIAVEVCKFYDLEQRELLLRHFDQYIDATRLEADAERSTEIPNLEQYWEVRILTSGMGTLLGLSELALQVHLPTEFIHSEAYSTLWVTTVIINSVINDLISLKKEMKASSVLNSVAILFHQYGDLDIAVDMSLDHIRKLVALFDHTADSVLSSVTDSREHDAISQVIDLMRTVNTGNLEWSLQAKRYGVAEHIMGDGHIELCL
ncbi:terpenoid synthase [Xylariaceae sp. FL0255]|nr:terpenoid synthase [Xylariaceae sp. FL0255]